MIERKPPNSVAATFEKKVSCWYDCGVTRFWEVIGLTLVSLYHVIAKDIRIKIAHTAAI